MPSPKTTAVLATITTGLSALEVIGETAASLLGLTTFDAAAVHAFLAGVVAVVNAFKNGADGTLDPEAINAELDKLTTSIADNDVAAGVQLDEKFPPAPPVTPAP